MRISALRAALVLAATALMASLPAPRPALANGLVDPGLPDLVARLLPTVVNITTTRYAAVNIAPGQSVMAQTAESGRTIWYGSGFIVRPDGYIVTNKHVVHNGVNFWVTLSDGRRLPADLITEAVDFDIAVIKVRSDKPLPTVKIGDSDTVRQGDFVIAIGNPLHHTSTVTTGIISALNRDMGFTPFDDYMQTDAAINEGNSGGPLFNAKGEVIGVNSALFTTGTSTGNIGIGLVIPVNDARFVVQNLKNRLAGKSSISWLGGEFQSITPELAEAYGLPGPWGSIVLNVPDGSPAAKAGLRRGDIIDSFAGKHPQDSRALMRDIVETPPGTTVDLGVLRDGKAQKLQATLIEMPSVDTYGTFLGGAGVAKPHIPSDALVNFGLQMAAITPELRAKYHLNEQQQGVVITGVAIGSTAADASINAGSVIEQVRDTTVTSPAGVLKEVGDERQQKRPFVPMLLSEPSGLRWVSLQMQ